jgi:molecular chaperone HscA
VRLEAGMASVEAACAGTDHRAVKSAVEALNRASEPFAARRMDRAISAALAGRKVDEVGK